jgi:hypothetical protein
MEIQMVETDGKKYFVTELSMIQRRIVWIACAQQKIIEERKSPIQSAKECARLTYLHNDLLKMYSVDDFFDERNKSLIEVQKEMNLGNGTKIVPPEDWFDSEPFEFKILWGAYIWVKEKLENAEFHGFSFQTVKDTCELFGIVYETDETLWSD